MKLKNGLLTACFASIASAVLAEPLYLLDEFNTSLYRIDTESIGTSVLIGSVAFGADDIELVGASSTRVYTFDRASESLVTVSTIDASVVDVVTLDRALVNNPRGFDLGIDGVLYGIFDGLELRSIDPLTGTTALVANLTGVSTVEAIAFASDGTLYASGAPSGNIGNQLYTVDIGTGGVSLIGGIGIEIDTLGFGINDVLYGGFSGPGRSRLYTIDTAAGALTDLGDTGIESIVGITRVLPVEVSLPGTVALLGLGVLGLGVRHLRDAGR